VVSSVMAVVDMQFVIWQITSPHHFAYKSGYISVVSATTANHLNCLACSITLRHPQVIQPEQLPLHRSLHTPVIRQPRDIRVSIWRCLSLGC